MDLISSEIGSFSKNYFKSEILKNKNIKVIIFPTISLMQFMLMEIFLFEDFYEWLEFLGKISKRLTMSGISKIGQIIQEKFKIYQPMTENLINDFVKKISKNKKTY